MKLWPAQKRWLNKRKKRGLPSRTPSSPPSVNRLPNTASRPNNFSVDVALLHRAPRAPIAPKYRDPKTGATWSGRGKAPQWIASARNRDRFLIPSAE